MSGGEPERRREPERGSEPVGGFLARSRWRYSRWDGTQRARSLDGDEILSRIADDLLYHGDLDAALRRLLNEGWRDQDGNSVLGLRELLDRVRQRRSERSAGDLSGIGDELVRGLDEVLATERQAIDQRGIAEAAAARSEERAEQARRRAAERHAELDLLPEDLSERIAALRRHDFVSPEAERRFEELLSKLRHDLAQLHLDRAAASLAQAGPEQREHLRAGLAALNRLLGQHAAGETLDPSFEQFMAEFGDLFPGASSLEELLDQLARRMAAASALMASLDDGQRAQLAALANELLGDLDLAWQIDQLASNLRSLLPQMGWDEGISMSGGPPIGLAEASQRFGELAELGRLEQLLSSAPTPGALSEVDPDAVSDLLGPDAAASLDALSQLTRRLEQAGLVARRQGRLQLSPRGLRRLGAKTLDELFARLKRDRLGDHPLAIPGIGHDPEGETKPYEYGDPFRLDVQETIRNAIGRQASRAGAGRALRAGEARAAGAGDGGVAGAGGAEAARAEAAGARGAPGAGAGPIELPIRLDPDDFAIERAEQVAAAATVLAVDLSLSMPMRDNFLAAKKVAIALQALIASRYPRDYLGLIGFSATAREIRPAELPEVSWDFAYGTNLQHTLALARRMLAHRPGARQIVLITDGEPTAHVLEDGEIFFHYPPVPETLEATLREVTRCTREGIRINTFALDVTGSLRAFVEEMTRRNRGRAFFTTPDTLGDYVLVDFVTHRGSSARRLRPGA